MSLIKIKNIFFENNCEVRERKRQIWREGRTCKLHRYERQSNVQQRAIQSQFLHFVLQQAGDSKYSTALQFHN